MSKYEKMLDCNRKASAEKIELAKKTIFEMLDDGEKITIPKLIAKTGLSRGFFYKNQIVRTVLDKALEQQVGMVDPERISLTWQWEMRLNSCTIKSEPCNLRTAVSEQRMKNCKRH